MRKRSLLHRGTRNLDYLDHSVQRQTTGTDTPVRPCVFFWFTGGEAFAFSCLQTSRRVGSSVNMNMIQLLSNATGQDPGLRQQAQAMLEEAEVKQTDQYLAELCNVMANPSNPPMLRNLAGLQIKNTLDARTDKGQEQKSQRYLSIAPGLRGNMKAQLMKVLVEEGDASKSVRRAAAQAIAKVGTIEIPQDQWPELLGTLSLIVRGPNVHEDAIVSTLNCIGYLCEELDEDCVLPASVNEILTAIISSMREGATWPVRLAATKSLNLSLSFTSGNMADVNEANMIVHHICLAAQVGVNSENENYIIQEDPSGMSEKIRMSAFECMVNLAQYFYENLGNYIPVFFQMTINAIMKDRDLVGLQAIEFWSTVCDAETNFGEEKNAHGELFSKRFIAGVDGAPGAMKDLIPLLLQKMCSVEEDTDDDEWTPAKSACVCINLIANLVEDNILPHVMPIIESWIVDQQMWQKRDAALYAFGAVMEGCTTEKLGGMIEGAITTLCDICGSDPAPAVQDTSLWVIAQVCSFHFDAVPNGTYDRVVEVILACITRSEKMASHACLALHSIAMSQEDSSDEESNILTRYYNPVLEALLNVSNAGDDDSSNLRLESHEALNEWVKNGAKDTVDVLEQITLEFLNRLERTIQLPDGPQKGNQQDALTGSLQIATRKLGPRATPVCDRIMQVALGVLQSTHPTAQAETLLLIGTVINIVEGNFIAYLDPLFPLLIKALQNHEEYHTCCIAVGLVGDLTRALEGSLTEQHCDAIVQQLLQALKNQHLDQSVKSPVIGAFGDIAMGLGQRFTRYFHPTMQILVEACMSTYDLTDTDEDEIEFFNEMRISLFETYTCILNGAAENGDTMKMNDFLPVILNFILLVAKDPNSNDMAMVNCATLIGDLIDSFADHVRLRIKNQEYYEVIAHISKRVEAAEDVDESALEVARYGVTAAQKLMQT